MYKDLIKYNKSNLKHEFYLLNYINLYLFYFILNYLLIS